MAFMSAVTSRRLESKSPMPPDRPKRKASSPIPVRQPSPVPVPDPPAAVSRDHASCGISQCGEFVGGIRCMQVHKRPAAGTDSLSVWTGEQDGALSVRDWQGLGLFTIEKKPSVFVTALLCHGNEHFPSKYVYAGLSDGSVRVYEQVALHQRPEPTYKLVCEVRRHSAAVLCMTAVRQYVVTGGRDWWMFVWEWKGGRPAAGSAQFGVSKGAHGGKLALHKNNVCCIVYDQLRGMLYSGGDDASIYATPCHTGVPNPSDSRELCVGSRSAHRRGVTALVVYEAFLFSSSEDGSVKVWYTLREASGGALEGGQLLRVVCRLEHPIRCLTRDPAAGRIWAGGSDGIIRVFNAHTFEPVCEISDEHLGAVVTGLHCVGRADAVKWWVAGTDGVMRVLYLESEAPEQEHTAAAEVDLSFRVDRLRAVTIGNYLELDKRKCSLARLQHIDRQRCAKLRDALGGRAESRVKQRYLHNLRTWHARACAERKRRATAENMLRCSGHGLRCLYFRKLHEYQRSRLRIKTVLRLSESLRSRNNDSLQCLYFKNLREYTRRYNQRRIRLLAAEALMGGPVKKRLAAVFTPWLDYFRQQSRSAKRKVICQILMTASDGGIRIIYWAKLKAFLVRELATQKRQQLCGLVAGMSDDGMRAVYWKKLAQWNRERKAAKRQQAVAQVLLGGTDAGLRRIYMRKALMFRAESERQVLTWELDRLGGAVAELEGVLEADDMTDEEIAAATAELQDDVVTIEADIDRIEARVQLQQDAVDALRNRVRRKERPNIELNLAGDTQEDKVVDMMIKLGAAGVSCHRDAGILKASRQGRSVPPAQQFLHGFRELRNGMRGWLSAKGHCDGTGLGDAGADEALSQNPWEVPMEWSMSIDRKTLQVCASGLKQMILAVHRLQNVLVYPRTEQAVRSGRRLSAYPEQMGVLSKLGHLLDQVVGNADVLLEIVFRANEDQEAEEAAAAAASDAEDSPRLGDTLRRRARSPPPAEPDASVRLSSSQALSSSQRGAAAARSGRDLSSSANRPRSPAAGAGRGSSGSRPRSPAASSGRGFRLRDPPAPRAGRIARGARQ
eukprot:TRINITY_DN1593_c0_g4_i1.p1 TRINITY_DN1593_c0_g4~~TRINITY_DN1593_c0_g4_i1.p1  ORF type:complete len:1069 (+),score=192.45 TRINITY_DN1593_c0_g4_i1:86-3292(+)